MTAAARSTSRSASDKGTSGGRGPPPAGDVSGPPGEVQAQDACRRSTRERQSGVVDATPGAQLGEGLPGRPVERLSKQGQVVALLDSQRDADAIGAQLLLAPKQQVDPRGGEVVTGEVREG